jgi:phosphate starvation-inducible protein PhoH
MPDFIDVRVRVRAERLGQLVLDLPDYAQMLGVEALRKEEREVKVSTKKEPKYSLSEPRGTKIRKVEQYLKSAHQNGKRDIRLADIAAGTGYTYMQCSSTLNNLDRKRMVKRDNGIIIPTERLLNG